MTLSLLQFTIVKTVDIPLRAQSLSSFRNLTLPGHKTLFPLHSVGELLTKEN